MFSVHFLQRRDDRQQSLNHPRQHLHRTQRARAPAGQARGKLSPVHPVPRRLRVRPRACAGDGQDHRRGEHGERQRGGQGRGDADGVAAGAPLGRDGGEDVRGDEGVLQEAKGGGKL